MREPYIIHNGHHIKKGNALPSRILYPEEFIALCNVIEKMGKSHRDDLTNIKMCLLTGARYEETRWIQRHHESYSKEGRTIKVSTKKVKVAIKERTIRMSNMAVNEINHFFNVDKMLPTLACWDKKLKRWANLAGITDNGVSSRMLRKTYESWLIYYFDGKDKAILKSQGHNDITALEHYIGLPFLDKDREAMKQFVDGWI